MKRTTWTRRGRWLAASFAVVTVLLTNNPAAADDVAVQYGWWSQANTGSPATPPAPPDVPADGLLVQNAPDGPLALAAVAFMLRPGTTAASLTMRLTGQPVITSPPLACRVKTTFTATENGPWTSRPSYDCSRQVTGLLNANGTAVSFDVHALARTTQLAVVIIAGGPSDRFAMEAPTLASLSIKSSPTTASVSPPAQAVSSAAPSTTTPQHGQAPPLPFTPFSSAALPPPALTPAVSGGQAPEVATSAQAPVAVNNPNRSSAAADNWRSSVGTAAGIAMLLLVLAYWAEGFGALPRRSRALRPSPAPQTGQP